MLSRHGLSSGTKVKLAKKKNSRERLPREPILSRPAALLLRGQLLRGY